MRLIERQMNDAILNQKDWKNDNTEVVYYSGNDASDVYLHGNLIARVHPFSIELFDGGVQSKTTKSRLNAILKEHGNGARIFQQNFQWVVIDVDNNAPIPFFSGMRLN